MLFVIHCTHLFVIQGDPASSSSCRCRCIHWHVYFYTSLFDIHCMHLQADPNSSSTCCTCAHWHVYFKQFCLLFIVHIFIVHIFKVKHGSKGCCNESSDEGNSRPCCMRLSLLCMLYCVCECAHLYMIYAPVSCKLYAHVSNIHLAMHAYSFECMYACMNVCMHVCMCPPVYLSVCLCVFLYCLYCLSVNMSVCLSACVSVCMCVCSCVYACMYVCM